MSTSTTSKNQISNTVLGKVTDGSGRPLANLKVEIYDVDMRQWQRLADTLTKKDGKYKLKWQHHQLTGREKKTADIAVRISTRERNVELFKSSMNEVRFNAAEREEINISINKALPRDVIEFDYLSREVAFLAGKVAIRNLQENDNDRDVTFLSNELDVPAEKIEHLVVAHRLQRLSKIDPDFFYALMRKDTLLGNDFSKGLSTRLSIGISTDDKTLLYDAALTDKKRIRTALQSAIADKIVAPAVRLRVTKKSCPP